MVTLYGLKTCDMCRKAIKALKTAGKDVSFVDVRADGVSADLLSAWIAEHGAAALVNSRSTTWRGLGEEDRARANTDTGAVSLLVEHPPLMKRPVIVDGAKVSVGWSKAVQTALL